MNLPWSAAGLELLFPSEEQHVGCRSSGLEQQSWELMPQVRVACVGWGGNFWVSWAGWAAWAGPQGCGFKSGSWHLCQRVNLSSLVIYLSSGGDALACESFHQLLLSLCLQMCHNCWFYVLPTLWHCAGCSISFIAFFSGQSSSTTVPLQPLSVLVQSLPTCLVCMSLMLRKLGWLLLWPSTV